VEKRRTETSRPEASWILSSKRGSYAPIIFGVCLLLMFGLAVYLTRG
jgi:hypothetical protein